MYERMSERLPVYMELLKDLDAEKKFEASLQQKLSDKEEGFNRIYESDDWGKTFCLTFHIPRKNSDTCIDFHRKTS